MTARPADTRPPTGTVPDAAGYLPPVVSGEPVEVSRGVHVIADRRVPLVPNIGIVVGQTGALVIDTGAGPANGARVLEHARRLADGRPLYVAITQFDPGHGFGVQAFKGEAAIIYSQAQRTRSMRYAEAYLETFRGMGEAVAGQLEGMNPVEPDIVHTDRCEIDLGGVRARLRSWGPAHTGDDQTVLIDDRVLFGGDLFQTRMFPILPYFPPFDTGFDGSRWIGALDELIALETPVVVPGHGEVTDTAAIRQVRDYLGYVRARMSRARTEGVSFEEAAASLEKEALARWTSWDTPRWIRFVAQAFHQEMA